MAGGRVLIVEDEMLVCAHLRVNLQSLGYQVIGEVGSGEKAIQSVHSQRPDIVLMDILLEVLFINWTVLHKKSGNSR